LDTVWGFIQLRYSDKTHKTHVFHHNKLKYTQITKSGNVMLALKSLWSVLKSEAIT